MAVKNAARPSERQQGELNIRRLAHLLVPIVALIGASGASVQAGAAPVGAEFQVNTYTTGTQGYPAVAMNAAGGFVVVWESRQDGSFSGVLGQMFDSAGNRVGGEFQVNTYTTNTQFYPAVAMDGNGRFVVVWSSFLQDGSLSGVFGQRFGTGGSLVGSEFQVNTYTTASQAHPAVAMNEAGAFVVAWESSLQDGSSSGVFGQRFDSGGNLVGSEFQVNTYTTSDQYAPAVGIDGASRFVVAWSSFGQDGYGSGVFAQMFDSGGSPAGSETQVNTYTTNTQFDPAVGMNTAGDFVVAWYSNAQDGSGSGVFGRMFDSAGAPVGSEFQVNTYTTRYQWNAAVAMTTAGEFVVAWQSDTQDGSSYGVFGRMFDSGGSPVGADFQVNTYTTYYQGLPVIAVDAAGDFVVTWASYAQDGSSRGVFAQRGVTNGLSLVSPAPGDMVDCSDPAPNRPVITWDPGDYDRFRVLMGSSVGFETGSWVATGTLPATSSWVPSKGQWKIACNKSITQASDPNNPLMYIAVEGEDRDLYRKDALRSLRSFPVRTRVQP